MSAGLLGQFKENFLDFRTLLFQQKQEVHLCKKMWMWLHRCAKKRKMSVAHDGWMRVSGELVWAMKFITAKKDKKGWRKARKKKNVGCRWFHVCFGWVVFRCHCNCSGSLMKRNPALKLWFRNCFHFNGEKLKIGKCVCFQNIFWTQNKVAGEKAGEKRGLTDNNRWIDKQMWY